MKGLGTRLQCGVACVRNEMDNARDRKVRIAAALVLIGGGLLALAYNGAMEQFKSILQAGFAMFSLSGLGAAIRFNLLG